MRKGKVAKATPATEPTRRAVLAAAAGALPLLLTACKGIQALGTPPPPGADVRELRQAIAVEEQLIARCTAAIGPGGAASAGSAAAADTALAAAVTSVLAEHRQHLAQLKSRLIEPAGSASASPPRQPGSPLPVGLADAVPALQRAEQAASDALIGRLGGLPPSLAQLFASIAASEATHVPFLQAAREAS